MMYSYPSWGFPGFRKNYYPGVNYYRPGYYNYKINNNLSKSSNNSNKPSNTSNNSTISNKSTTNKNNTNNTNNSPIFNMIEKSSIFSQNENSTLDFSCDDNYYSDSECFNLFGLSLHMDDLLILALIFFLYKEGIDDMYLFIALFLLLLS